MTDLMIDIESWGKTGGAAIASIAVVAFDPEGDDWFQATEDTKVPENMQRPFPSPGNEHLVMHIDFNDCIDAGLVVDESTLAEYWLTDVGRLSREEWLDARTNSELVTLEYAYQSLALFGAQVDVLERVWSHSFDMELLHPAFAAAGFAKMPWSYRSESDLRERENVTAKLVGLAEKSSGPGANVPPIRDNPRKHDPLWDAWHQALRVQRSNEILRAVVR